MSVLKRKRNISKMEFYHNAIKLRLMMTEFLLRDFGIKSRRRNLDFAKDVYDMEDEDISQIEEILSAYDIKNSFIDNFPNWLIDKERDYFMDLLRDMMKNICSANTIHITNKEEYYMRRNYQTQAICNCENLLQEMQYIIYVCHPNVEKYMKYVDMIEKDLFDSLKYAKSNTEKTGEKYIHKSLGIGSQISQISGIYYPSKMDNYCKIVKGIKFYGRYMDDTYIISNSKEELKQLLIEIDKICTNLGIFINHKKTQIFKLDKGFKFLKIQYRLTETGHLVRIPVKNTFVREKRKLKSFKRMLDSGQMTFKDIQEQYKSWRGNLLKYDCHCTLRSVDALFNDLFIKKDLKKEVKKSVIEKPLESKKQVQLTIFDFI